MNDNDADAYRREDALRMSLEMKSAIAPDTLAEMPDAVETLTAGLPLCEHGYQFDCQSCEDEKKSHGFYHNLPTVTQAMYYVAASGNVELAGQLLKAKYSELTENDAAQMADEAWELLLTMLPCEMSNDDACAYHVLRVALIQAVEDDSTGLIVDIQKEITKLIAGSK